MKKIKKIKDYKLPRKNIRKIKASFFMYDSNLDILEIRTEGKTHHSINIDDFAIIDLNDKNKVIGLEFFNIAKLYDIPKKILQNLKSSKILIHHVPEENKIFIKVKLESVINSIENITSLTTPPISAPIHAISP